MRKQYQEQSQHTQAKPNDMDKSSLVLSTPRRLCLLPASSDSIKRIEDEYVYCIRRNGSVFHLKTSPCHMCCDLCNYDTHRCLGCGTPLPHGAMVCDPCTCEAIAWELDRRMGRE